MNFVKLDEMFRKKVVKKKDGEGFDKFILKKCKKFIIMEEGEGDFSFVRSVVSKDEVRNLYKYFMKVLYILKVFI